MRKRYSGVERTSRERQKRSTSKRQKSFLRNHLTVPKKPKGDHWRLKMRSENNFKKQRDKLVRKTESRTVTKGLFTNIKALRAQKFLCIPFFGSPSTIAQHARVTQKNQCNFKHNLNRNSEN